MVLTNPLGKYQETSSVARQEVNKMKALAILTMIFLPATFAAVSFRPYNFIRR